MSIGCTGTSSRTPHTLVSEKITLRLQQLFNDGHEEFHHGDCIGVDAWMATTAKNIGYRIICHPPIKSYKRAFIAYDECWPEKQYLERNHDIVDHSDILLAVPNTPKEEVRSGTWATVRYARKKHVPVEVFV